ncbi:MAG: hypothetical protein ABIO44_05780, partial [Saprospiraceae bacterium]
EGKYWYQEMGEVNSYELEQARYGQLHKGEAVLVFVTEDFNGTKQVKLDNLEQAGSNRQPMFKMNMLKHFNTGIYTYSLMMSVFSPIGSEVPRHPLKITTSVQDWCGHVFTQLNQRDNKFFIQNYSYFESEGDVSKSFTIGWTEDELWSQIRINPRYLPIGKQKLLTGFFYNRLKHRPQDYFDVELKLISVNDTIQSYQIDYTTEKRNLAINFKKSYPYQIVSWTESYKDGENIMTTKATLKKSILIDYWNKHNVEDLHYRKELDLSK